MNQKIYKLAVNYYIWHGEGDCDNKTGDLREALHIRADLLADGHIGAYILDSFDQEVDDHYLARLFVNVRLVSESVSDPDDEDAAGLYRVTLNDELMTKHQLRREELAEVALKVFDAHQGIEHLPDFEIEVVDAFGRVVNPDRLYDGFGGDEGDVERVGAPLTELREPKEVKSDIRKLLEEALVANQTLTAALSEVAGWLEGLGMDITYDRVLGTDNLDWVTAARYVADVALGLRVAYPDHATLSEWVGLHYGCNFDAESAEKRSEWAERYMHAHA